MCIRDSLTAVENAVANAKVLGAGVDDTLYMNCNAIVSSSSKAASADGDAGYVGRGLAGGVGGEGPGLLIPLGPDGAGLAHRCV